MNNKLIRCFVFAMVLPVIGCVTTPDQQTGPVESNGELAEPGKRRTEDSMPDEPAQEPILAREIQQQEPELAAVKYLLDQAQKALDNFEVDRASALSDRALQIDRKSPRAYLVLAQIQSLKKKPEQARVIARQGLLYTPENSLVGQQLLALTQ